MEEINVIIGAVASALQMDAPELVAELKDGENWLEKEALLEKLKGRVSDQVKAVKDAQYKRGVRESRVSVESWVKAQGFTPEGDLKGTALLEAYAEHLKGDSTKVEPDKVKTLTKEELAALPEVKQLMAGAYEKGGLETKATLDAISKEYQEFKRKSEKESISDFALRFVAQALEDGDVLLEPEGVKEISKPKRIEKVYRGLDIDRLKVVAINGKKTLVFVDENGDIEEDDMGQPKDVGKYVVEEARSIYGPRGPNSKLGGGNPQGGNGNPGGNGNKYKQEYFFKSAKDYSDTMSYEADATKRAKMSEDFQFQQQQAAG